MAKRPGANKSNYEETQRIFLALARLEFATYGYARASTSRIVEQSGMARGSLYYHFKDKEDLFRTIFKNLTAASNAEIERLISTIDSPFEALAQGADLFFSHALDPTFRRIILIEALVAIPYLERIAITSETYARTLKRVIEQARLQGELASHVNIDEFCLMLYGLMTEAARSLEYANDAEAAKLSLIKTYRWILDSMRAKTR